uniref:Uncharacterized protein n=1 Tax=Aureoumbra lagunensis TaxID=44058 RepID=A0A7S3JYN0_9STRA|mmetsp:Transcript_15054/g.19917  ORF Transcript_15054/g.19917 Transcript_15054/m.19917 type:complete len:187 (+) Transcript_15054:105-665(+)|eukprot:CAMPEP_0197302576 /NCGR_PEP_ID=MMETSP0890-20130614/51132_1 /TAXON_ID=44058 ORGANISM="Aureoumbra lagunensis, Strain CCMP1510" /NCGR_SAMPLE_ID=MMETSP0890 /ASSEMBLY_ACC=CAM_ASM_000533 /LENGTH=186 /DNA_ID=CAMNT_0042782213 /DNA_START=94 /DNA_END=654 /DNA_ORIENTATION=+
MVIPELQETSDALRASIAELGSGKRVLVPSTSGFDGIKLQKMNHDVIVLATTTEDFEKLKAWEEKNLTSPIKNLELRGESFFKSKECADVIWDYAYLASLDPSLHELWGQAVERIVRGTGLVAIHLWPPGTAHRSLSIDQVSSIIGKYGFNPVKKIKVNNDIDSKVVIWQRLHSNAVVENMTATYK